MIDTSPGGPPADRHQLSPVVLVAAVCEGLALAASVAANLAAVWADGTVAIVAAGLVPLILIGATYLFLFDRLQVAWRLPWPGTKRTEGRDGAPGWQAWWANLVAAALILVPVASASYWHQRELLVAAATPHWIATLLPLAVDGLALRAALTLFRLAHAGTEAATEASAATPTSTGDEQFDADPAGDEHDDDNGEHDDEPAPVLLPAVGNLAPEVIERAFAILDAEPTMGRPALAKALEVGDSPAKRLQTAWKLHRSTLRSVGAGEAS